MRLLYHIAVWNANVFCRLLEDSLPEGIAVMEAHCFEIRRPRGEFRLAGAERFSADLTSPAFSWFEVLSPQQNVKAQGVHLPCR